MIKVGIIGATGYVGVELVRLLTNHKEVEIEFVSSRSYGGKNFDEVYQNYNKVFEDLIEEQGLDGIGDKVDAVFLALPHGLSSKMIESKHLKDVKIIDLSADFRISDKKVYEKWYKTKHENEKLIGQAVYGLCEWKEEEIRKSKLIANPGCYTTCSILSLAPLLKDGLLQEDSIIIDAKSGVSGAGRNASLETSYTQVNENIKAYSLFSHRHKPEIEEQLSKISGKKIDLVFTPHLIPMNRGILATVYAKLKDGISENDVKESYETHYSKKKFIRLLKEGAFPQTKWVKGSNFCDIGFKVEAESGRIIIVAAIDNIVKGAAGQAVQNMNLMFGFKEDEGLRGASIFPV